MNSNKDSAYFTSILLLVEEKHTEIVDTLKELAKDKDASIDTYEFHLNEAKNCAELKAKTIEYIRRLTYGHFR